MYKKYSASPWGKGPKIKFSFFLGHDINIESVRSTHCVLEKIKVHSKEVIKLSSNGKAHDTTDNIITYKDIRASRSFLLIRPSSNSQGLEEHWAHWEFPCSVSM